MSTAFYSANIALNLLNCYVFLSPLNLICLVLFIGLSSSSRWNKDFDNAYLLLCFELFFKLFFLQASQIVKDKIKEFEKEESIENEVSKGSKRSEKANSVQNKQGKASSEKDISTNGKSVDQKTGKVTAEEVEEEKEIDEISTRSTAKSGTLSLKSIHAKVGSFRKKGDKAMVFNKYNEQVYFEQSPPERFFWPKHF